MYLRCNLAVYPHPSIYRNLNHTRTKVRFDNTHVCTGSYKRVKNPAENTYVVFGWVWGDVEFEACFLKHVDDAVRVVVFLGTRKVS